MDRQFATAFASPAAQDRNAKRTADRKASAIHQEFLRAQAEVAAAVAHNEQQTFNEMKQAAIEALEIWS